jgi:hypothetical protein
MDSSNVYEFDYYLCGKQCKYFNSIKLYLLKVQELSIDSLIDSNTISFGALRTIQLQPTVPLLDADIMYSNIFDIPFN